MRWCIAFTLLLHMSLSSVVHITDIHYDMYFIEHSSEVKHCHRGIIPPLADSISVVAGELQAADTVVWGGDATRHNSDSDLPVTEQEHWDTQVSLWLKQWWPNARQYIITIGNNDVYPHDQLGQGPNEVLGNISMAFTEYLSADQQATFLQGGYYHANGFISLNRSAGLSQLEWLNSTLSDLVGDVVIVSHVPPGKDDWYPDCLAEYVKVISAHKSKISGQWYGHTHDDHFELLPDDAGVILVAPAIEPNYNAGVRLYHNNTYTQYFTRILHSDWRTEYTANSAYDMGDLSTESFKKLKNEIDSDPVCKHALLYDLHRVVEG